ncbi:MAG: IclR family transcriptional regulator [Chloroflexota bacterium]|jgi:DNA-binding IclR family transcriptional regulator|nr:IclR family transcriptional regulator [Chloroflexota bacterium]
MSSIQSVKRAFDVLSSLGDGPLGVTEVADRAGLPKSTAARVLATLVGEGAVEQVPGDTSYRLGPRLITLAGGFSLTRSLAAIARSTLVELAQASGEAAGLGMPDGDLVHYIDQVDTVQPVLVRDWTGARVPLHAVSSGQVLLAFRTPAAIERYLERPMEGFTARTLTEPDAVRERLREVRRHGYAWAMDEFETGISSIAAPIADASGEVIAAVHVHGPSYRFPASGTQADVAQVVLSAAAQIAAGLREA